MKIDCEKLKKYLKSKRLTYDIVSRKIGISKPCLVNYLLEHTEMPLSVLTKITNEFYDGNPKSFIIYEQNEIDRMQSKCLRSINDEVIMGIVSKHVSEEIKELTSTIKKGILE